MTPDDDAPVRLIARSDAPRRPRSTVDVHCALELELASGRRVPLLTDRGWSADGTWDLVTVRDLDEAAGEIIESLSDPDDGLCRSNSTFERSDVARAWCERLPPGTRLHRARLETLIDTATADARLVPIDPGSSDSPVVVGADGEAVPVGVVTPRRWSTVELLAVELVPVRGVCLHGRPGPGRLVQQPRAPLPQRRGRGLLGR